MAGKIRITILGCVGAAAILTGSGFPAFGQTVPPPSPSEKTKEQERMMVGAPMKLYYYKTPKDKASVLQYYRNALKKQGWKEFKPLEVLEGLPVPEQYNLKIDESLRGYAEQNVIFSKDEQTIVLNFLPGEFNKDGKTYFTIAEGAPMSPSAKPSTMEGGMVFPELLATPKNMPVPAYPQAKLMSLQESPLLSTAVYNTKSSPADVLEYYRGKAQETGWTLLEDIPMHAVDQGALPSPSDAECPSCAKAKLDSSVGRAQMKIELGELVFTNSQKQALRIGVSEVFSQPPGMEKPLQFTTVVVIYGQEK